ncbi:MAG: EcsC family protein [Planctomycetaceae bacterium]|nr:EcsC family protein [Planctomycetaceae bacterium]MCB9949798.1 EcsC family protein [Planctomycetaceae bacterium]
MTSTNVTNSDDGQAASSYELAAIREIHAWKNPKASWFDQTLSYLNKPLDRAGGVVFSAPGVGPVITSSIKGLVELCNDLAQWSVSRETIYAELRKHGHDIQALDDIARLDLEEIDRVVGWLSTKYKSLTAASGAGAGMAGLLGIPPDIVALITLNLRGIGEYATYYGFDLSSQEERLFAMNVLGLASSPTDASKCVAMAQLVRIAQDVARKRTWSHLQQHSFVKVTQSIAKALGIRLTKAKLAQVVPLSGALIGGGFNSYFTSKVCNAASNLYRERFLARKYGADVIEVTVAPADDFDPHYPEESEVP